MDLEALNAMSLQLRRDVVEMVYRTKMVIQVPVFQLQTLLPPSTLR